MLAGELRENRLLQIHPLTALHHRRLQQIEKAAHGLEQHHVVRRLGNRQMKTHVGLRGEIRVVALGKLQHRVEAVAQLFFILRGGAQRRIPRGAGFNGVARL